MKLKPSKGREGYFGGANDRHGSETMARDSELSRAAGVPHKWADDVARQLRQRPRQAHRPRGK